MEITKGIQIRDLSLYIEKEKILILSDIHLGYEEALNKQGVLIPRFQFKDIMQKLEKLVNETKPETIILNGDIKHEFGQISEQEWRETLQVIDYLKKNCKQLILIKGNHDKITDVIANKRNMSTSKQHIINDIYITHGDFIPKDAKFKKAKTIIIGHEHPAISLREGNRVEKFKCFLKGKYKDKTLIVMPSLNPITEGTDILQESLLSPFLDQDIKNFKVFIVADKVYEFGEIRKLAAKK
jgi:putative SbcD/Mre11-related phosphoesterase